MERVSFERVAGGAAVAVGLGGILYSVAFLQYLYNGSTAALRVSDALLVGGALLSTGVLIAVYERVRPANPSFALWALVLGLGGAFGAAIHGGYNLALEVKAVGDPPLYTSIVDPRGLMTFGVTGLALGLFSVLIARSGAFPRPIGYVGLVAAALFLIVYFGRLIIYNAKNPLVLTAAVVSGFVLNPVWFAWVGATLLRRQARPVEPVGTS
jgi:hypothetical protein